jgi:hypothetical protein
MRSLKRSCRCYWSAVHCNGRATCSWSRLTAFMLGSLQEVLLFTEARSMERAGQRSPMKPESWSGWFPLKSSPTCSYRWSHCDLQNVPREDANCTAGTVLANWREASWLLTDWLTALNSESESLCDWQSVSQYVLVSSPLRDLRPDVIFL